MRIDIREKKADDQVILSEIRLEFPDKGLIFITGRSGAGKTTLLNIMNGLDMDFDGEVVFQGVRAGTDAYKKMVGIIYQDFNLIGALSVRDNIFLGAQIAGQEIEQALYEDILEKLEIQHLEQREVSMLSGGEKQRVAIARALLRKNQLLFADEPTGNLDEKNSDNIYRIFKELSKERLVIVVTHDLQAARRYKDRLIEIRDGKVYEDTEPGYKTVGEDAPGRNPVYVKHHWRFHYICQGLKARKKKMTSMTVTLLISMLCTFLTLGLYSGISGMLRQIDSAVLENDRFDLCNALEFLQKRNKGIEEAALKEAESYGFCSYVTGFYQTNIQLRAGDREVGTAYEYIEDNAFYRERYSNITGALPATADEVMIDEMMALQLFDTEDCVGRTLILAVGGIERTVAISGVKNSYQTADGGGSVFITQPLIDEIYGQMTQDVFIVPRQSGDEEQCICYVSLDRAADDLTLLQGRMPQSQGEIAVDVLMVNQILTDLNLSGVLYSQEDIKNGSVNELLFSAELALTTTDFTELADANIVGIVENRSDKLMVYYGEWYSEIRQKMTGMSLFVNDLSEKTLDTIADFAERYGLYYEQNAKALGSVIRNQVSIAIFGLGFVSIMIFIISGLMIHLFMKLTIIERRYEMGVLVSLGSTEKDIVSLLLWEQILTAGGICVLLDIVCFLAGGFLASGVVKYNGLVIFHSQWWHYVVVDALVCAAMILFSLGDIVKISKGNTALALADRYR